MKDFIQFINERFINMFVGDEQLKKRYQKQVWSLIQNSYKSIGGIKTSGFESEDSILDIPFWKLAVKSGKVEALVMYKDKDGRKSVAVASTGSQWAKSKVRECTRKT